MRKAVFILLVLIVAGALAFYLITVPVTLPASALPDHAPAIAAFLKGLPPRADAVKKSDTISGDDAAQD